MRLQVRRTASWFLRCSFRRRVRCSISRSRACRAFSSRISIARFQCDSMDPLEEAGSRHESGTPRAMSRAREGKVEHGGLQRRSAKRGWE